jgi:hypothetical protein
MHQPAWLLWDTIKLAGIEPTTRGYTVRPLLPMRDFSLRLPNVGLVWGARRVSGYVRAARRGLLRMVVRAPSDGIHRVVVDGQIVPSRRRGADVVFDLAVRPGRAARWAIVR